MPNARSIRKLLISGNADLEFIDIATETVAAMSIQDNERENEGCFPPPRYYFGHEKLGWHILQRLGPSRAPKAA